MRLALVFFHFIGLLFACAHKLDVHDLKSFKRTLKHITSEISSNENGAAILKMPADLRDRIGIQKFGPLFKAFNTMPDKLKIYAITQMIKNYHYYFVSLPPRELLDPVMTAHESDEKFITTVKELLEEMETSGPGFPRIGKRTSSPLPLEAVKELTDFLAQFKANPKAFQAEMDFMFPIPTSYKDALKDATRNILLIQRTFAAKNKKNIQRILTHFEDTRYKRWLLDQLFFDTCNKHVCNKMLNKIGAGFRKGGRNAVILVHGFALLHCHVTEAMTALPGVIMEELRQMPVGREREYAKWKMMVMKARMKVRNEPLVPEIWFLAKSFFHGLMSRVMLSLRPCLTEEEAKTKVDSFWNPLINFRKALRPQLFKEEVYSLKPKKAQQFYLNLVEQEIPKILDSEPDKFAALRDLSDEKMSMLLTLIQDTEVAHPNVMYFGGADAFERKEAESSESGASRAEQRKARRARRKLQKELHARRIRPVPRPKRSVHATSSEPLLETEIEAITIETPEAEFEDKAAGKEEEEVLGESSSNSNGSSNGSFEDISDSEPSVSDDDDEGSDEAVQDEWKEIEQEQLRLFQHYKLLEKLRIDHAKLQRNQIRLQTEASIAKEKPRVVASFSTDDLCFLFPEANQLYADNKANDSASTILSSGGAVALRWIFNPAVVIDKDDYQFLCRLFNMGRGKGKLDFDDFLRTFQVLNPNKARLSRKELARCVFQFEHAFETEDQVFVPPIGGGHREHMSSGFNHDEIRRFMMNGGAHPYFFELIKSK